MRHTTAWQEAHPRARCVFRVDAHVHVPSYTTRWPQLQLPVHPLNVVDGILQAGRSLRKGKLGALRQLLEQLVAVQRRVLKVSKQLSCLQSTSMPACSFMLSTTPWNVLEDMNVNSMAHMWLAKKFLPPMIERDSGAREKGEHGGSSALVLTRRAQDTG